MRLTGNFEKKLQKKFGNFFSHILFFLRAFVVSSCRKSGFRVFLSLRYGADLGGSRLVLVFLVLGGSNFFYELQCECFACFSLSEEGKNTEAFVFCIRSCRTFNGFPRHKRVVDGYARCLLCKADLSIAGRGLSSLWEHWRGVELTRLEQKYRIMMQMPSLNKACHPVTAEEDRRIRQE